LKLADNIFKWLGQRIKSVSDIPGGGIAVEYLEEERGADTGQDLIASETAFQKHADVYFCTNLVATTLAQLPKKLYQKKGEDVEEIKEHPIVDILKKPNRTMGVAEFYQDIYGYYILDNNLYIYTQYSKVGFPYGFSTFQPSKMWVLPDEQRGVAGYKHEYRSGHFVEYKIKEWSLQGDPVIQPREPYDGAKIMHIKGFNPTNPYYGLSRVTPNTRRINTDLQAWKLEESILKNRGMTPLAIKSKQGHPNESEAKRQAAIYQKVFQGYANAGKLAYLYGDADLIELGKYIKEMNFEKLTDKTREHIVNAWEVPQALAGILKHSTLANMDAMSKNFWYYTGIPILGMVDGALNNNFLKRSFPKEHEAGYFIETDLSGVEILQEDELRKADIDCKYVSSGVKTPNEVRATLGLERHPDGDSLRGTGESPIDLERIEMMLDPVLREKIQAGIKDVKEGRVYDLDILDDNGHKDTATITETITKIAETIKTDRGIKAKTEPVAVKLEPSPVWDAHEKRLQEHEEDFSKTVAKFFEGQRDRVLAKIKDNDLIGNSKSVKAIEDWIDSTYEIEKMIEEVLPGLQEMMRTSGQEALDALGLELTFDMEAVSVQQFLATKYNTMFPEVTDYTLLVLRDIMEDAEINSLTIAEIQNAIRDQFGQWIEGTSTSMSRALRIARTESNSVVSGAKQYAWESSDVVKKKVWTTARDKNVRDTHIEAEGQEVELGKPFTVGGEIMMHPGDPAASPSETVNCRCDMVAVVEE